MSEEENIAAGEFRGAPVTFPVKSRALRRFMITKDMQCPECGAIALDTGNECNVCKFDAMPEVSK